MDAPAAKAFPFPVRTMAPMVSSWSKDRHACIRSSNNESESALSVLG